MRRFRFNLEPALRLRCRQEAEAQLELAAKQRLLAGEQARLEELRQELRRHESALSGMLGRWLDVPALVNSDQYAAALATMISHQEERTAAAASAVEACLQALRQRRIARESLERLREQRLAEHRLEQLRTEQADLDESAVRRWRRD